ncbi:MAG: recombinational DNA repair protein (RecF pathway) [Planctomycetota bacterium]
MSAHHGRVEIIARGAHRPKSRFSGVLDWFDTLALDWMPPRDASAARTETARISGLGTLRSGDIQVRRRWITASLDTYRAAHTVLELVEVATRSGFVDDEIYPLLEATLSEFNEVGHAAKQAQEAEGDDPLDASPGLELLPWRLARFELRLMQALGLEPALRVCATCGEAAPAVHSPGGPPADGTPHEPRAPFSPQAGGRLCARHAREAHASGWKVGTLPVHVLDAADALVRGGGKSLTTPHGTNVAQFGERILDFAGRFLDHQLETRPKSHAEFLGAPDRNRRARPLGKDA